MKIPVFFESLLSKLPKMPSFLKPLTAYRPLLDQLYKKEQTQEFQQLSIGLDVGRTHIDMIQTVQVNGAPMIEKYIHHQILPDAPVSAQLKHIFLTAGITHKRVRVSVKGQGVILRFISFPRMPRNDFQSALQYEAEKYLPFAISEVVLDFHIIEAPKSQAESMKTMDVILIAARTQEIMRIIKLLQESELQVESIGVDAIACTNALLGSNQGAAQKTFALIDFGEKDTNINIIDHGELRFSRDIAFGRADVMQFLKRKFQLADEQIEAIQKSDAQGKVEHADMLRQSFGLLIQDIKTSLNYFYGQHPEVERPTLILVSGGLAASNLLRDAINNEMHLLPLMWNPAESLTLTPAVKKEDLLEFQHYLPVCLGLALT